jgi:hypothetical protein
MKKNSAFLNLLGQIRLYSLIDLILLTIAINASFFQIIGTIFLHTGFLLFLEKTHKHKYRTPFPKNSYAIITLIGLFFYKSFSAIGFLLFSFFYAKKTILHFLPLPLYLGECRDIF